MKSPLARLRLSCTAFLAVIFASCLFLTTPAEAAPAKWEYTVASARLKNRNLENLLNSYAAQGWELVQITDNGVAIFKRLKS